MYKCIVLITVSFSVCLGWLLYMANTAQDTVFFALARGIPSGDKLSHILLFGLLTLLLNLSTHCRTLSLRNTQLYMGSVTVFIFVTIEELSQYSLPSRTFDLADYAASCIGVLLFSLATTRLKPCIPSG